MMSILKIKDSDLIHTGVAWDDNPPGRGSGRYPHGSGENPNQHEFGFLSEVKKLRKDGLTDAEIAKALLGDKATTTKLRAEIAIQESAQRKANVAEVIRLYDECHGNASEVGRRMGINESTVRSLLKPALAERSNRYENTANMLKDVIEKNKNNESKGMIDVGSGTELHLGVTDFTKKVALEMLDKEGYVKSWVQVPTGPDKKTTITVLAPPGTSFSEIQKNKYNIASIREFTPDEGKTWWTPEFPESLSSSRIFVRYADEGGKEKDGVVELRRGVEDISLGSAHYAQVRIAVDGTHFIKGMAMYSDDIPKGYDVVVNTNKKKGTPLIGEKDHEVLKRMKINEQTGEVDRDNPFGALIKSPKEKDGLISAGGQRHYIDKDGNEKLSPINKLREEGDWDSWSRTLSTQFLSKQPLKLINQQIDLSLKDKEVELEQIRKLTNPVIKQKLLNDFAETCDANAADLSVKGFKNQAYQVILPIPSLSENEIYAPKFKNGDTVALVRYPHGGIFEIPVLKVNNKREVVDFDKTMKDAVGINPKVAEQLSGADFDGDTAMVIPLRSNHIAVSHSEPLQGLKGFDPKESYKLPDDAPRMTNRAKQNEMGRVTNLIADMTIQGANEREICRAVRHSMVVIDAEKHHLDYKKSAQDNDILTLKRSYQRDEETGSMGAATVITRAGSEAHIPKRREITATWKMTPEQLKRWNEGKKVYEDTGETALELIKDPKKMTSEELKIHEAGKKVYRQTNELRTVTVDRMYTVDDAMDLVRDPSNNTEVAYAKYANSLKSLANQARKESRSIKPTPVDTTAKKTYAKEVADLNAKLRIAEMNAPKERKAQALANRYVSEKLQSNPDMDHEHKKREQALALIRARAVVGAKKEPVVITDREWEAIQANAITTNKLKKILQNTDQEAFKKRATPKQTNELSAAQIAKIKAMSNSGMYTQREIADSLGVSTSTISKALK